MAFGRMRRNWVRVLGSSLAPEAYTVYIQLLSLVLFPQRECHDNIHSVYVLYWSQKDPFAIIQQQFTLIQLFPLLVRRILRNDWENLGIKTCTSHRNVSHGPLAPSPSLFVLFSYMAAHASSWVLSISDPLLVLSSCFCSLGMVILLFKTCFKRCHPPHFWGDRINCSLLWVPPSAQDPSSSLLHTFNISHCLADEKSLGYWLLYMSEFSSDIQEITRWLWKAW